MTRYGAAALLNACLDSVTGMTDELKRLVAEFETELAVIAGRVDGMEARVGELEATQFSTTTKLSGYTAWVAGAAKEGSMGEAFTLNYDLRLGLKTSFTGEDMLTTVLWSGNFDDSTFYDGLNFFETAMASDNTVKVGRLFYTFPVGDSLTVTGGPIVRTDDSGMYAGYATFYPSDLLFDFFTYGGAWGTNQLAGTGSGLGAVYSIGETGFSVSGNYVAMTGADSSAGIGTDETEFTSSWQLFYEGEILDGSFLAQAGFAVNRGVGFTMAMTDDPGGDSSSYSFAAAWKPADAGFIPSVSTGFSSTEIDDSDADYSAWYVGLEWSDVFIEGNSFGGGIGESPNSAAGDDTSTLWEVFYSMPITDNITITPALYGIADDDGEDDVFGGIVKTTFTF